MAVTNGWGQAAKNNTNGFGKLATNNIGAGSVYEDSYSGDTALIGVSAAFSYSAASFTQVDSDPTPTITGTTGGTFSGTSGLVFVSTSTGEIDLSASTIAAHVITYTISGVSSTFNLSVTAAPFSNVYSFEFDGVDDYFDLSTGLNYFDYEAGGYTVSCWAKWTGTIFNKKMMNFGDNNFKFSLWQAPTNSGNSISVALNKANGQKLILSGWSRSGVTLNDGNWHHIGIVIRQNTGSTFPMATAWAGLFDVYIDGSNSTTGTYAGSLAISSENTLSAPSTKQMTGSMDEISVFNSALSSAAITEIYNSGVPNSLNSLTNASTPVVWFRMGENATFSNPGGAGNWTIIDQGSATNNNGTSVNMEEADRKTNTP